MIIGLPILDNRIAPVFDVARDILLVIVNDDTIIKQELLVLPADANEKITKLVDAGVDTLLCGAISTAMDCSLKRHEIQVVSFLNGNVKSVLRGWFDNKLHEIEFLMPGCRKKHGCDGSLKRLRHGRGLGCNYRN
jgi:predicted Fe-Mo cluster-binding NifX family protein